jgi:hypothetical protein
VEHHLEESGQRLDTLADHVLDFAHELFLAFLLEGHDFHIGELLVLVEVGAVVAVFKDELEFSKVLATLELSVVLIFEEPFSQTSADSFSVAIVYVEKHHLWT